MGNTALHHIRTTETHHPQGDWRGNTSAPGGRGGRVEPILNTRLRMPTKLQLLILSASIGVIALIAACAWLWRRKTRATPVTRFDLLPDEKPTFPRIGSETETTLQENSPSEPPTRTTAADLAELVLKITDPEIRAFLEEITARTQEEEPRFGMDTSMGFIEEMIDRVDDLAAMTRNHDGQTAANLVAFREAIIGMLSSCDAEIINTATWDPTLQRAISKEPTSGITEPTILRFGSTGFRRGGQLIRKQEVVLAVPESN